MGDQNKRLVPITTYGTPGTQRTTLGTVPSATVWVVRTAVITNGSGNGGQFYWTPSGGSEMLLGTAQNGTGNIIGYFRTFVVMQAGDLVTFKGTLSTDKATLFGVEVT